MMLHHLLAALVVYTTPGGFGVVLFIRRVLGAFRIFFIMQTTTCKTQ